VSEKLQTPPVGWCVWFYPHALENETPHAAIVVSEGYGNALKLAVFNPVGRVIVRDGVRHIGDPKLSDLSEEARVRTGAWSYIPGHEYGKGHPDPAGVAKRAAKRLATVMSKKGVPTKEIAAALGEGWSVEQVNELLRK